MEIKNILLYASSSGPENRVRRTGNRMLNRTGGSDEREAAGKNCSDVKDRGLNLIRSGQSERPGTREAERQ
jgi:hypothetical protein